MDNELKRVGLVFEENGAVSFRQTLKDVNLELNKNYNQFKLTQAQWDNSTSSTKKLKSQQEYLTNAIAIQNDKVKVLKMHLSELESAEDKDTAAIRRKRAELTNAEAKLANYENQLKDVENELKNTGKKITEFGTEVTNAGKKIEDAGKKVKVFSAAVAAAFAGSAKSAIDFESAFTGVEKTVDGTKKQLEELKQGIRAMAREMPSTTTEISAVAEAAGQLGIKTEDILSFTRVMIDLGNSTNLSAEEAASALAKFANVTKMSAKDYDKLGSTIVALGNNFATTEADIVSMATRLAATGELAGLSQSQILSLATAMSSVGIEAEAGGSAMSKLLKQIQLATELGGEKLNQFASVAGMTTTEFKQAFEKDAVSALISFISGLNDTERNGKSAIAILSDMDLTEVRLSNTILSLANSSALLTNAVELGSKAWQDNTALSEEANKRYGTLASKIQVAIQKLQDIGITIGEKLMPVIEKIIGKVEEWANKFSELSDEEVDTIVKIGLIVAAIGPLITIVGKVISAIGGVTKGVGTVIQAIQVASGSITSASTAINGLAAVFSAVSSPIGLACIGITAAIAGISIAISNAEKETKQSFENIGDSATQAYTAIYEAESYLDSFNRTLFVTSQEQQELAQNMQEVQNGITNICRTAMEERRSFTDEEIKKLDEYFNRLRELNQREIEVEQAISEAITQQAVTTAESLKGTSDEYETQAERWIKTAIEQKDKTLNIVEKQAVEEIALLNQKYNVSGKAQIDAYDKELSELNNKYKKEALMQKDEYILEINNLTAKYGSEATIQNDAYVKEIEELNQKYGIELNLQNETFEKEIQKLNEKYGIEESMQNEAYILELEKLNHKYGNEANMQSEAYTKELQELNSKYNIKADLQNKDYTNELEQLNNKYNIEESIQKNAYINEISMIKEKYGNEANMQNEAYVKEIEELNKKYGIEINVQSDTYKEELNALNEKYNNADNIQTEAYKKEYEKLLQNKQDKIDLANDEVAKVSQAYLDGYTERSKQNDSFFNVLKGYDSKFEEESQRHANKLKWIDNNYILTEYDKNKKREDEDYNHQQRLKAIWNKIAKDMSDEQEKELGTWLAKQAQTELYGGEISEENKKMVDNILNSYNSMDKETREAMKNAMAPMLEEMKNKEPALFSKASSIANGILSRLKKAFDIHSPSKKTRAIFKNVMKRNGRRN